MGLSNHVTITITQDTVGASRLGFGILMILSHNAAWATDRIRFYTSLAAVAVDFAVTSPEYLAAQVAFSQTPKPTKIAIGRAANKPTQKFLIEVTTARASYTYRLRVEGQGVTSTDISFTTGTGSFTVDSVDAGTNTFTKTAHGLTANQIVRLTTSGALPTGVNNTTTYYAVGVTTNTFQLALTSGGAAIDISDSGTNTQVQTASNDVIMSGLTEKLNAVVGKNYTAARTGSVGTEDLEATGSAAGNWFSIENVLTSINWDDLKVTQTHADPGLAADLAAIALASSDWYALYTLYNSNAYVLAAAAWVEANKKLYIADICDTDVITTAVGGSDTIDDLKTADYARTAGVWHPEPASFLGVGWLAVRLPYDPGSETWKYASVKGPAVPSLTPTQRDNLTNKRGNSLELVAGKRVMFNGQVADGNFIDVTRGLDWLENEMQTAVFEVLAGAVKVPFTDPGIAMVEAAMKKVIKKAVTQQVLTKDPAPAVTVPKASEVSSTDRANRHLPDLKFSGQLAGAIHSGDIDGVVSV